MTGALAIGRLAAAVAAILVSLGVALAEPQGTVSVPSCAVPPALSAIEPTLDRSSARIDRGKPLTIVAMGSSSTQGGGASTPAMSYPSRLEAELRDRFPTVEIHVLNRGIGGQDIGEELTRLDRDVIAEHPNLVIWQLGTNAVLRRDDLTADEQLIGRGVALIKKSGIDLVLMDLQYAPRVLARPAWREMERIIDETSRSAQVGLFRQFEIMREWDHTHQLGSAAMVGPDGLHMTDVSYGCLADQLAEALAWNWWSRGKLAKSSHSSPMRWSGSIGVGPHR